MKNRFFSVTLLVALFTIQAVYAEDQIRKKSEHDGHEWLKKISSAPRHHNFQGTFIYYADGYIESSRIIHKVDETGEHERIEVLDGLTRIVYRTNDALKCYLPDSKKVYSEERWFRKFFPDLLPQPSERIYENYAYEKGKLERVAGYESQVVKLVPRDNLRYGYKMWVDVDSGLLLRMAVIDKDAVIEQFAFVTIEIGKEIDDRLLNTDSMSISDDWKTIKLSTFALGDDEPVWRLGELPVGFKKVTEMKRNLVDKSGLVDHIVLSDELASVSVFIESMDNETASPLPGFYSSRGAINIYVRELENKKITAVGEVPLNTIKLIGDAVLLRP
ncbi:MAG: MucB/RseB C-terminal domain-containing protein [Nitrosomonas sp.]|nr:MucB/RseB C-terminal domain-containing protein [Nitrosomonas sp.]